MAIYNIYVVFITKRFSAFKKCDQRNLHIWSSNTFLICINIMLLKHQESYWVLCLRKATEKNNNNDKNIFKKKKRIAIELNCFLLDNAETIVYWKQSQDVCPAPNLL